MKTNILKCGHSPNAIQILKDGTQIPSCVICDCNEFEEQIPDLTGRKARCQYCSKEVDSSFELPFFKKGGDATSANQEILKQRNAMLKENWDRHDSELKEKRRAILMELNQKLLDTATRDSYYCGCRGWD